MTASPDHESGLLAATARATAVRWRLRAAAMLAAAGAGLFAVDVPVARWFRDHRLPGDIGRLVDLSEVFAHGLAVAVLLGLTAILDRGLRSVHRSKPARWELLRLVAAAYAGALVVDLLKLAITRVRPRAADLEMVTTAMATFGRQAAVEGARGADFMSFPSGHAAAAAGLATALAWRYPHGAGAFAALAGCAMLQRVASSAHYPSDVAFGAAVGVAAAAACLGRARPVVAPAGPA